MAKSAAVFESSSSGSRPVLKGRHALFMKKHLSIGLAYAFACVIFTKIAVNDPRKRAYAEYYKWVSPKKGAFPSRSIRFPDTQREY